MMRRPKLRGLIGLTLAASALLLARGAFQTRGAGSAPPPPRPDQQPRSFWMNAANTPAEKAPQQVPVATDPEQAPLAASAAGRPGVSPAAAGRVTIARHPDPVESRAMMPTGNSRPAANSAWRAGRGRVPRDSFLEYRAETVEALARQAETNPRVRARYAKHFGVPSRDVARYIRQNLVVSYLPSSGRYTMYYVSPGERIYRRQVTLPRGARVLALRNGEPVMRWICGNAMVPALPPVVVAPAREVPPVPLVSVPSEQVVAVPRVVTIPTEVAVTRQVIPPAPVPVPVAAVPVPVAAVAAPVPVTVPAAVPAVPIPAAVVVPPAILPPVGPPPVVPPPAVAELPPPEIPVPEPNTIAVLTLAALPVLRAAVRGRRRALAA